MAMFVNLYNYASYCNFLDELKYNTPVDPRSKFTSAIENATKMHCTDIKWYSNDIADVKFGIFWSVTVSVVDGYFTYE